MQNLIVVSVPPVVDEVFVERVRKILDGITWLRIGHSTNCEAVAGELLRRKPTFEFRAFHKFHLKRKSVFVDVSEFLDAFGGGVGVVVVTRELAVAFADCLLGDLTFHSLVVQPCPKDGECFLLRRQESGKLVSFQVITDNKAFVVEEPKSLVVLETAKPIVEDSLTSKAVEVPIQVPPALSFGKRDGRGNKPEQLPAPLKVLNLKRQLTYRQSGQLTRTRAQVDLKSFKFSDAP